MTARDFINETLLPKLERELADEAKGNRQYLAGFEDALKAMTQFIESHRDQMGCQRRVTSISNTRRLRNAGRRIRLISPVTGWHPLKGDLKGFWAVTVRANWRIKFRFEDTDAFDVELTDYH